MAAHPAPRETALVPPLIGILQEKPGWALVDRCEEAGGRATGSCRSRGPSERLSAGGAGSAGPERTAGCTWWAPAADRPSPSCRPCGSASSSPTRASWTQRVHARGRSEGRGEGLPGDSCERARDAARATVFSFPRTIPLAGPVCVVGHRSSSLVLACSLPLASQRPPRPRPAHSLSLSFFLVFFRPSACPSVVCVCTSGLSVLSLSLPSLPSVLQCLGFGFSLSLPA